MLKLFQMFWQNSLRFSRVVYVLNWHIELCFRCFGKAFYALALAPSSMKERAHSLLSYSVSSVKVHIFSLVDRQKRIRILQVWFCKKGESLVRCGRGLNINYAAICMVQFTYFNSRLLTYPKIYMFNFVCDQYRFNLDCFFFLFFQLLSTFL